MPPCSLDQLRSTHSLQQHSTRCLVADLREKSLSLPQGSLGTAESVLQNWARFPRIHYPGFTLG